MTMHGTFAAIALLVTTTTVLAFENNRVDQQKTCRKHPVAYLYVDTAEDSDSIIPRGPNFPPPVLFNQATAEPALQGDAAHLDLVGNLPVDSSESKKAVMDGHEGFVSSSQLPTISHPASLIACSGGYLDDMTMTGTNHHLVHTPVSNKDTKVMTAKKEFVSGGVFLPSFSHDGLAMPAQRNIHPRSPVVLNEGNVEFTAGVLGGLVGFAVAGPYGAAAASAAANFVSRQEDGDASVMLQGVSKSVLEAYNYFVALEAKYYLPYQMSRDTAVKKLKESQLNDFKVIDMVETLLETGILPHVEKFNVRGAWGVAVMALGAVGDFVEQTVHTVVDLNQELQPMDRLTNGIAGVTANVVGEPAKAVGKGTIAMIRSKLQNALQAAFFS